MGMTISGKAANAGGDFVTVPEGTHEVTLGGTDADIVARLYWNAEYESSMAGNADARDLLQLDLIFDPDMVGENDAGEEVDLLVYDSFIRLSMNEKANLVKRLKALVPGLDPAAADLTLVFADPHQWGGNASDDAPTEEQIPHRLDGKIDVADILIDGESLKGRACLLTIEHNDKGYAKVTNSTSLPVKRSKSKAKKPADLPA